MKSKYNNGIQISLYIQQTLFLELEHFSEGLLQRASLAKGENVHRLGYTTT